MPATTRTRTTRTTRSRGTTAISDSSLPQSSTEADLEQMKMERRRTTEQRKRGRQHVENPTDSSAQSRSRRKLQEQTNDAQAVMSGALPIADEAEDDELKTNRTRTVQSQSRSRGSGKDTTLDAGVGAGRDVQNHATRRALQAQKNTSHDQILTEPTTEQSSIISRTKLGGLHFKKRARQPSLLKIAQASMHDNGNYGQIDDENNSLLDQDLEDLEDIDAFLPDDESTPFVKATIRHNNYAKDNEPDHVAGTESSLPKRKRSLEDLRGDRRRSARLSQAEQIEQGTRTPIQQRSVARSSGPDSIRQTARSTLNHEGELLVPTSVSPQTPSSQIFSSTMAPPQSSSSVSSFTPPQAIDLRENHRPQRKMNQANDQQTSAALRPRKALEPLNTMQLQNLLPHRRAREILGSESDEGDFFSPMHGNNNDENSFHVQAPSRKSAAGNARRTKPSKTRTKAQDRTPAPKRYSNTYSRGRDVKNNSDDSETDGPDAVHARSSAKKSRAPHVSMNNSTKAEMARIAAKFKEVDDFPLEFEEMTSGNSSQLQDAR